MQGKAKSYSLNVFAFLALSGKMEEICKGLVAANIEKITIGAVRAFEHWQQTFYKSIAANRSDLYNCYK